MLFVVEQTRNIIKSLQTTGHKTTESTWFLIISCPRDIFNIFFNHSVIKLDESNSQKNVLCRLKSLYQSLPKTKTKSQQ